MPKSKESRRLGNTSAIKMMVKPSNDKRNLGRTVHLLLDRTADSVSGALEAECNKSYHDFASSCVEILHTVLGSMLPRRSCLPNGLA